MEIEWKTEDAIEKIVKKLWYSMTDTTSINTTKVYDKYGIDLKSIANLTF